MSVTDSKMDVIKQKIAAVMAKTVENGATQDEAFAAAQFARDLMKKHSLTLEDIADRKIGREDFVERRASRGDRHPCDGFLAVQIGKYTGTKAYFLRQTHQGQKIRALGGVHFFGYRPDTELAKYIYTVARSACDTMWDKYKVQLPVGHRAKNRVAYQTGVAEKIAYRIWQLMDEEPETTGTDLIVLKNRLVEAAFADQQGYTMKNTIVPKEYDGEAWYGGWNDGDKVNFHRELGGKAKAIGR